VDRQSRPTNPHPPLTINPLHTETTAQKFYRHNKNILKQRNIVSVITNIRCAVQKRCYLRDKTVSFCCFYVINTELYATTPFGKALSTAGRNGKTLTVKKSHYDWTFPAIKQTRISLTLFFYRKRTNKHILNQCLSKTQLNSTELHVLASLKLT